MAEKKTVKEVTEEVIVKEEPMVTIKLEKSRDNKLPLFVSVNGKSWMIQRGENVTVPLYVAEVIENHNKMMAARMEFEDSLETSFESQSKNH